ncbi:MAG TPA: metal ABC transporter permease [Candidatus Andersenbacteria bacterium]|nr:metal ABC transporter permease [Candidatus Andersenbacteria bacterium]
MLELLQYGFVVRGLLAGIIIAIIAPFIGIFLVLRRYSLIADTLSHVSFAGIAIGFLFGINPIVTAIIASVLSSVAIERLRLSKKIYGESALSIFLSGSLAIAIVLISLYHGFNTNLTNYLFGSIVTVQQSDLALIFLMSIIVIALLAGFYKELIYISFDEDAATVSGIPVRLINVILIVLAALVVALSIPIIGILLISALIVIPVLTALQFRRSFKYTLIIAEAVSVCSVIAGIIIAFYANLSTGGTIVIVALACFMVAFMLNFYRSNSHTGSLTP